MIGNVILTSLNYQCFGLEKSHERFLGGGFKEFLCSPQKLGKIPILTNIFQRDCPRTSFCCQSFFRGERSFTLRMAMVRRLPKRLLTSLILPKGIGNQPSSLWSRRREGVESSMMFVPEN